MPWRKDETTEIAAKYSMPERLRMAFVELGPTFVKLGQVLAQRQDMIPPDFVHEFSKLQDKVPPFGMDLVRQQIRTELGRELEDVFRHDREERCTLLTPQLWKDKFSLCTRFSGRFFSLIKNAL